MPQFPLVASANMSRSFCVILGRFFVVHCPNKIWLFNEILQYHSLSIFDELLAFGCELHLEMMVCVTFVVSLMGCDISGVWMCMLNYVLNKLHVQYTKTNCQYTKQTV